MLKIHPDQMEAFSAALVRDFEDRMVDHLQRCFPEPARALGEDGLRETIRHGTRRAAEYGIVGEHDVALYLNLTVALGRDFDTDPLLPWVRAVLLDGALPEPNLRMTRLYHRAVQRTQLPGEHEHE